MLGMKRPNVSAKTVTVEQVDSFWFIFAGYTQKQTTCHQLNVGSTLSEVVRHSHLIPVLDRCKVGGGRCFSPSLSSDLCVWVPVKTSEEKLKLLNQTSQSLSASQSRPQSVCVWFYFPPHRHTVQSYQPKITQCASVRADQLSRATDAWYWWTTSWSQNRCKLSRKESLRFTERSWAQVTKEMELFSLE